MAIRGCPPGRPKSPNSGKKAGTPNKKKMTTAEMRSQIHDDLVAVYQKLGGVEWLLKIAQEYPLEFLRQGWARLAPPFLKDSPDTVNQLSVNVQLDSLSELEKARRIAFVLNSASDRLGLPVNEHKPATTSNWTLPDPIHTEPVNVAEMAKQQKDDEVLRNTRECTIETYPGDSAQQGSRKRRDLI